MKKLILIMLVLISGNLYASELVHLTIENRQVVGTDYTADIYATPDGTWRVGPCTIIIDYNSIGLDAATYDGISLANFDSGLSGAGYTCKQGDYGTGQVSIDLFILTPSVDKTAKFKLGTVKFAIEDDTEKDDLEFNPEETEVLANLTELTYGCSTSSCWKATTPATRVIGGGTTLGTPTLSTPADNATSVSTTPTFDWSDVTGATSYNIEVATENTFASPVIDSDPTSSGYTPATALSAGTTYYWRVNATDGSDTSAWSTVWDFTTETTGGSGELVHLTIENRQVVGTDYTADIYATPDGTWRVGPCTIVIDYNATGLDAATYDGISLANFDSGLSGAGYTCKQGDYGTGQVSIDLFILTPSVDKTAKFKLGTVKFAIDDNTENDDLGFNSSETEVLANLTALTYGCATSTCWDATDPTTRVIGGGTTLGTPTLSTPADNATSVSTTPAFDWSDVTGATGYNIEVSTVNTFATTVIDQVVTTSTYAPTSALAKNTIYYWRANATDGSDTSAWSEVWEFTTKDTTYAVPTSWAFTDSTGNNATIIVKDTDLILLCNRAIKAGDAIGAFYKDGTVEKCAGYGVWVDGANMAFTAWGDNDQTAEKDGFASAENLVYKMWDASIGVEYYVTYNLFSGATTYAANGINMIDEMSAICSVTHNLKFNKGWNMVSSYIVTENDSITVICQPVVDNILLGKNGGGAIYYPELGIDQIKTWNLEEGYLFYMTKADTLQIEGNAADAGHPIYLNKGWNMIAYLYDTSQDIGVAFAGINSNILLAKNGGGAIYYPELLIDQINNLNPGEGYLVYMTAKDTLEYPTPPQTPPLKPTAGSVYTTKFANPSCNNATVILSSSMPDGTEITAYNTSGDVLGSGLISNGIAAISIYGDDEFTDAIDGAKIGENIRFKAQFANIEQDLELTDIKGVISNMEYSSITYHTNDLISAKVSNEVVSTGGLLSLYPNPTTNNAELSINLLQQNDLTIELYDNNGKRIKEVYQGQYINSLTINTSDLPSGTYQVMVKTQNETETIRLLIVK